ncbi:MAG: hypothetical protein HKN60_05125 [Rhizobiales bacterium]|nr:hypothetical protein [Hyphomicrobiales bacterium]
MSDVAEAAVPLERARINWSYLWAVAAAAAALIWVVNADSHWMLNFFHVITGLMWTGIDLFMGFVIGPILRRVDLSARRAIVTRLAPRMLFLMPTLAICASIAGIELAERAGYMAVGWPQYGWVLASLVVVTILTIQGLGILLPINVMVFLQLRTSNPDLERVGKLMRIYFFTVASQGVMQVVIILVMARFVTGL